jgi:hypothetical protein
MPFIAYQDVSGLPLNCGVSPSPTTRKGVTPPGRVPFIGQHSHLLWYPFDEQEQANTYIS